MAISINYSFNEHVASLRVLQESLAFQCASTEQQNNAIELEQVAFNRRSELASFLGCAEYFMRVLANRNRARQKHLLQDIDTGFALDPLAVSIGSLALTNHSAACAFEHLKAQLWLQFTTSEVHGNNPLILMKMLLPFAVPCHDWGAFNPEAMRLLFREPLAQLSNTQYTGMLHWRDRRTHDGLVGFFPELRLVVSANHGEAVDRAIISSFPMSLSVRRGSTTHESARWLAKPAVSNGTSHSNLHSSMLSEWLAAITRWQFQDLLIDSSVPHYDLVLNYESTSAVDLFKGAISASKVAAGSDWMNPSLASAEPL